ncbi:hypothetical protein EXIGLDRAFT_737354 [Exidia glandulosa HHB12029]|uniref:Uncharacterized protein n=1 Tax=Exidia glandulosa HHB12029 TaxID=1314781 RepID=A0A165Z1J0_EXIGL|nr:hypothetical protein EXIGLDRAFT_737354 [Exidia glandulosa HHB12029]
MDVACGPPLAVQLALLVDSGTTGDLPTLSTSAAPILIPNSTRESDTDCYDVAFWLGGVQALTKASYVRVELDTKTRTALLHTFQGGTVLLYCRC